MQRDVQLAAVIGRDVSRETLDKLHAYEGMVRDEARRQNLVSAGALDAFWNRHVLDSAQLLRFSSLANARWVDLGSGAGLPGIVIACVLGRPVTLIEPRRLRADFLLRASVALDLGCEVICSKVERATGKYDVITARAVAQLSQLFEMAAHLSTGKTVWALPKGRNAAAELEQALQTWQGVFHVEQSATDPESGIIVASGVTRR